MFVTLQPHSTLEEEDEEEEAWDESTDLEALAVETDRQAIHSLKRSFDCGAFHPLQRVECAY